MNDDQLTRLLRSLEEPDTPAPDFADALFSELELVAAQPERRVLATGVLMAAALLLSLVVGTALVVGSGLHLPWEARRDVPPTGPTEPPIATASPSVPVTPKPGATATATDNADALPAGEVLLEPGTYSYQAGLWDMGTLRVTFRVPAGWTSHDGWYVSSGPILTDSRAVSLMLWAGDQWIGLAYTHLCQRQSFWGLFEADELAALLAGNGAHATAPVDIVLSGVSGKAVEIWTDPSFDTSGCIDGQLEPWQGRSVLPGTRQLLWVLDVHGPAPLVIEASTEAEASAADRAALAEILDSITIEVHCGSDPRIFTDDGLRDGCD